MTDVTISSELLLDAATGNEAHARLAWAAEIAETVGACELIVLRDGTWACRVRQSDSAGAWYVDIPRTYGPAGARRLMADARTDRIAAYNRRPVAACAA
ncbi:MAG: hypothetical protein D6773_18720 [Alphaproteobacteria bacterium]|nr:MAG: hypothetical protein D6773_18720 [Alphaproteobacteria bacterium]